MLSGVQFAGWGLQGGCKQALAQNPSTELVIRPEFRGAFRKVYLNPHGSPYSRPYRTLQRPLGGFAFVGFMRPTAIA